MEYHEPTESEVESLRRDIGEKMARDNDGVPAEYASDSLKEGYRRGVIGFGSNVNPRNFGRGRNQPTPWKCVCGHENKRYLRRCWVCNTHRSYGEDLG